MRDSIAYQIVLNDKTYRCKGYSEIQLVVPIKWITRKPKDKRGFWDNLLGLDKKSHFKKETIDILKVDAIKVDKPMPLRESYVTVLSQEEKISEVLVEEKISATYIISEKDQKCILEALRSLASYTDNVYNHADYSCATEVARLHFRDRGIEIYNNRGLPLWIMDSAEIQNLIEFMNLPNRFIPDYTNWQLACYKWNCENYIFESDEWFRDYMDGKLDVKYSSNKAYIPSTQKMPETWDFR